MEWSIRLHPNTKRSSIAHFGNPKPVPMKTSSRANSSFGWLYLGFTLAFVALAVLASARKPHNDAPSASNPDKSLAPYFHLPNGDATIDRLPLKSTSADVNIAGIIADVTISQVYVNEGSRSIEALYVFPASTHAAVYAMRMKIGDRVIEAQIKEKKAARQEYEAAKAAGQSASLLEQKRPNVFEMNVANILPGDRIEVQLQYTETLIPEEGIYEFVYPTVVGPRYSNTPAATASTDESFVETPYTKEGELPEYAFGLNVNINSGIPLKDLRCQSHQINSEFTTPTNAKVSLKSSETHAGNRDFILQYRLRGEEVESGLMLYEGEEENYFMMTVQPPKRVTANQIPAREYIFILDVSGSMNGYPLDITKKLMDNLFNRLSPKDHFNVMHFAGSSKVMSPKSLPANAKNIQNALDHVNQHRGGGGTNLLPALHRALALPEKKGMSRTVVIATDGYVTVEKEAFELIRNNLGEANFFAFGIGSSVNRHIIEGMATVGMGEPFVVINQTEAMPQADKFMKYIESPVLTDIEVEYGDFDVYDTEPFGVPDVLAERPITIYGKYRGTPSGKISVTGTTGHGEYCQTFDMDKYPATAENSGLRYLWARERIKQLDDFQKIIPGSNNEQEVTQLGLDYNLMTAYTSFLAVDKEVRTNHAPAPVKQALPLPKGVSNMAIAANAAPMSPVTVSAEKARTDVKMSMQTISPKEIQKVPTVGGEADVAQYLEVVSGVCNGTSTPTVTSEEAGKFTYTWSNDGSNQKAVATAKQYALVKADTKAKEEQARAAAEKESGRSMAESGSASPHSYAEAAAAQQARAAAEAEEEARRRYQQAGSSTNAATTTEANGTDELTLDNSSPTAASPDPVLVDVDVDESEVLDVYMAGDSTEAIFTVVETMPAYPGGEVALHKFIMDNMQYPDLAREQGLQGRVYVRFVVNTDGTISNIEVVRGVHKLLDDEAVRVLKLMPKWAPGIQAGKTVKTQMILPFRFQPD